MIIRKTTAEEGKRVNELFAIAFELPAGDGPADETPNPRVHHWAAFEDNTQQMMSTFTISDFQFHFDGNSCKMGGIGGVATLPQYRRKGGIRGCFQHALPDMFREGYDLSYLYPFSTAYYRKFGYECCVQKMMVSLNLQLLKPTAVEGEFMMCEADSPMVQSVKTIDKHWESHYNMMVIHQDEDYKWLRETDPAGKQEFTYVYFSADHSPKAYTTFKKVDQPDGRNLVCSRFCFIDREGFHGLMNLFKSLSADHMLVKFSLPAFTSMEYLFPEWAMGAANWSIMNAGMVRVINVEKILKMATYQGTGSVCVQIQDNHIEENSGVYRIVFENNKAVTVEKCQESPDAELSIAAFSSLISGTMDLDSAGSWMNGVKILKDNPCLKQIFYRKPMMIVDYF